MPAAVLGDLVLWYPDPANPADGALGWIIEKPGRETVSILIFTQSAGFVEKKSVRHKDDPFWKESEMAPNWTQWGCWDFHESTATLKEIKTLLTAMKLSAAREALEPGKRGPGRPRKDEQTGEEVAA